MSTTVFEAVIDTDRNLVRTRYAGDMTAAGMHLAVAKMEELLPGLRPGFGVLADLSQVESMDLGCVPYLARVMDLCRDHGVGMVVRILPEPHKDIGINLISIVHYRGEVPTLTVDTLEEAERALS